MEHIQAHSSMAFYIPAAKPKNKEKERKKHTNKVDTGIWHLDCLQ